MKLEIESETIEEYVYDLSTGTGEGVLETEELNGYIESIAFETEQEVELLVETEGMMGEPILNLRTANRYFTPRISPTDSEGNRFNYGAQKIAVKGKLLIGIKGSAGKQAKLRLLITNN